MLVKDNDSIESLRFRACFEKLFVQQWDEEDELKVKGMQFACKVADYMAIMYYTRYHLSENIWRQRRTYGMFMSWEWDAHVREVGIKLLEDEIYRDM